MSAGTPREGLHIQAAPQYTFRLGPVQGLDGGNPVMAGIRCRFGMHSYHTTTNDEGSKYLVCARCGKETFPSSSSGPRIVV